MIHYLYIVIAVRFRRVWGFEAKRGGPRQIALTCSTRRHDVACLASPRAGAALIMTHLHSCNNEMGMPDCMAYAFNLNGARLTTLGRVTLLYGG